MVAELQELTEKLPTILPLLLDGVAFAVSMHLPERGQNGYIKSKQPILHVFGVNCYDAYDHEIPAKNTPRLGACRRIPVRPKKVGGIDWMEG